MKTIYTIPIFILSMSFAQFDDEFIRTDNFSNSRDNHFDLYWEWENDPRWLGGVNWGGQTFFGSLGFGEDFLGSSFLSDESFDVEIRFDSSEVTLCPTFRRDWNYSYGGIGTFNGSAWDVSNPDNPRRLNVCFVEWNDGSGEHQPNLIWNPDDSFRGRREYLLVMASDYDGDGTTYNDSNHPFNSDVVYGWWPKLESGFVMYESNPAILTVGVAYITNFYSYSDDQSLNLTWEINEESIDHFELWFGESPNADSMLTILSTETRAFTHTGLDNGEKYYYQLQAIDESGSPLYFSQIIWGKPNPISQNMNLLGTWDELDKYGDIWGYTDSVTGTEYALICARDDGLSIIDISSTPIEVGFVSSNQIGNDAKDVKVYDHYAILIKEYEPAQIIDLSDPHNPEVVGQIHFGLSVGDGGAHNCYVDGNYLYSIGHDMGGVQVFNMENPAEPTLAGEYSTYYYHDIYVRNDTAYAAGIYGDGVDILDVSNKNNIQLIANFNYEGSGAHNCWTTEDGNYVIVGDEIGSGTYTRIFDIQDLSNIEMVSTFIVDEEAVVHNMYVKDNYLYIGHYTEGVRIVDLSDPTNPVEVGYYDTYLRNEYGYLGCWSVYPFFESGKIVASDMQSGLFVLEYDDELLVDKEPVPSSITLGYNYPNPFNPATSIPITLNQDSNVLLSIYNVKGEKVQTLFEGELKSGKHTLNWNGTSHLGRDLPTGVYLYQIKVGQESIRRKMVLLK